MSDSYFSMGGAALAGLAAKGDRGAASELERRAGKRPGRAAPLATRQPPAPASAPRRPPSERPAPSSRRAAGAPAALVAFVEAQGGQVLPDNAQYKNRFEIRSGSSDKVYIVAQRKSSNEFTCSCMGWIRCKDGVRTCKHIKLIAPRLMAAGIDGNTGVRRLPAQVAPARKRNSASFTDAAYRHYDASQGFGSADEWGAAADAAAAGKGVLRSKPAAGRWATDLAILRLTAMPSDIGGLKRAFRARMLVVHPDQGGTTAAAIELLAAFKRLAANY